MKLYAGIDLHSTNNYVVLLNEHGELKYKKRLPNDIQVVLHELSCFDNKIESIVVESTYNWYWLVDGLQSAGYCVRLANTNAIKQYDGLKHTNDKTDARWLAELNRLNILPEGYIYPKEERSIRDLVRKRMQLVQQQTLNILSIQTIIERTTSKRITGNKIKQLMEDELKNYLSGNVLHAAASNLAVLNCLQEQIDKIEKVLLSQVKVNPSYRRLQSVNGIGEILALTILLETGDIHRFKQVGHYSSYCRCVGSKRESNGKKKGENNRKNGNKYLAWAYVEAANFAIRHDKIIKRYYQRKSGRKNSTVAIKTIAHKLARACFYIIRDGVTFDVNLAFMN